jgi:ligand-binding sensor domain-containing protein
VYDICVNGYQDIWIAHNGGISYFLNGTFTNYDMNNSGLSLNLTRCILKYNNTIYIGTYGQGLDVFDLNKTSFSHFNINNSNLSNNFLSGFCVFENKLYVGTENGINAISL